MTARVVVFGAGGFIGRQVRLALDGDPRVTAVTCPGRAECDLLDTDVDGLSALLRLVSPDAVVNCAGRLDGSGYDLVLANTAVTAKLVEAIQTIPDIAGIHIMAMGYDAVTRDLVERTGLFPRPAA